LDKLKKLDRQRWFNVFKVTVSLVLIVLILRAVDLREVGAAILRANPLYIAGAFLMMLVGIVIRAYRWQILLDALGVRVPLGELTAIYFVGFLFNNILPSGVGGDAVRMYELSRHSERGADAVTSVFVDRFLGLLALLMLGALGLAFAWSMIPVEASLLVLVLFVGGVAGGWLLLNRPLWDRLKKLFPFLAKLENVKMVGAMLDSLHSYGWGAILRSFGVAVVFNVSLIAMTILIGEGLGAGARILHYVVFVPITSAVLVIPISFAGLGVREGAFVMLFTRVGVDGEVALSMSLMVYVIGTILPGLIGGLLYLVRGARGYRATS
jgi:uncharacterized membrane protein YbhN (UPF0104 family)